LGTLFQAKRGAAAAPIRTAFSSRVGFALDLGTVHDTPRGGVEGIATVHRTAVVPQNEIANPPFIVPSQLIAGRVSPNLVEQHFGLGEREPVDVGVAAATEIEALASRFGMCADERVDRARGFARIVARRYAGPDIAAAVIGPVVFYPEPGNALF
jgi:hypothetical protein